MIQQFYYSKSTQLFSLRQPNILNITKLIKENIDRDIYSPGAANIALDIQYQYRDEDQQDRQQFYNSDFYKDKDIDIELHPEYKLNTKNLYFLGYDDNKDLAVDRRTGKVYEISDEYEPPFKITAQDLVQYCKKNIDFMIKYKSNRSRYYDSKVVSKAIAFMNQLDTII